LDGGCLTKFTSFLIRVPMKNLEMFRNSEKVFKGLEKVLNSMISLILSLEKVLKIL
jgi:hypothetical protein